MNDRSDDETDNPLLADDRNFYKVEEWTKDGVKVDRMLHAGNNRDKKLLGRPQYKARSGRGALLMESS